MLHGAAQEPEAFQFTEPNWLTNFAAGAHRIEFLSRAPHAFQCLNCPKWLAEWEADLGEVRAAGIEFTLLDCPRWLHQASGVSQAQLMAMERFAKESNVKLLYPT